MEAISSEALEAKGARVKATKNVGMPAKVASSQAQYSQGGGRSYMPSRGMVAGPTCPAVGWWQVLHAQPCFSLGPADGVECQVRVYAEWCQVRVYVEW